MIKYMLFLGMICHGLALTAQTAISGQVERQGIAPAARVYLSQIALEDIPNFNKAVKVAEASVDANGFFEFKKNLIASKEAIYRVQIERFEAALNDTLQRDQLFIFSAKDRIHFEKTAIPFLKYTNSNLADKEWRRLRKFENQLRKTDIQKEDSLSDAYVADLKTYAKDSLEILMVKLIGIKQLENKALLEKDITKNPEYYLALLNELKESDINRAEYLFLENKLAFLTTEIAEEKYAISKIVILILGLLVLGLIVLVVRQRSTENRFNTAGLSKQERNIQGLILQGKSNKEIANELFISLSTVKTHITNIYSKLQVSNRSELLQKAQNS